MDQKPQYEVNPLTGESFLRLLPPHDINFILTPPRKSDKFSMIAALNDPRVYQWLLGPPYPYLPEHADEWIEHTSRQADALLQELRDLQDKADGPYLVSGCPFKIIREVKDDGTDVFLGDVSIGRNDYEYKSFAERETLVQERTEKRPGDPGICWCFGDYLVASHHGRGIMTTAMATIINKWAVPYMGVRYMECVAFEGNVGSVRVFEKNGFVLKGLLKNSVEVRGEVKNEHVLEWRYKY